MIDRELAPTQPAFTCSKPTMKTREQCVKFLQSSQKRHQIGLRLLELLPVNVGVLQGSIYGSTLFLLYIDDLPDDVICNIAIYADDNTLYPKCDRTSDLWQRLELTSKLESDLRDL